MTEDSHIGIRITIKEFEYLEKGLINAIKRPSTNFWKSALLEPILDEEEKLKWIPKTQKKLIVYTNNKKEKYSKDYEINEIYEKGKNITVKIKNSLPQNEEITIRIFGEDYNDVTEILKKNEITQISNLLKEINKKR